MVRTPCEMVPSTPARVAYSALKSLVLSRLAPGLQRLILLLRSDRDRAAHMATRLRAEPQTGTGLTVFGGEFDFNDLVDSVVDGRRPATADVSLWAGGLLVFPIDEKMIGIEASLLAGLPLMVSTGRTHQIDLVVLLALEQQFGIHIARIDTMLIWQEVFVLEAFMNDGGSGIIGNRSGGRFDMGDQMRTAFFTGFGQMDLLAHPGGTALFTVMRLDIVGRANILGSRRNVLGRAPADRALDAGVVLQPDLPEDFDGRNLTQETRGCCIRDGAEQAGSIRPNHFRIGLPCFFS